MNTSLQWLTDFLPGAKLDAQAAGDALTGGGLPVEHFEQRGDGDVMLDVEVTSNRSDCLSHVGVARELSALLNLRFQDAETPVSEVLRRPGSSAEHGLTSLTIDAPGLCPHYTPCVIRNVKIAPSPA